MYYGRPKFHLDIYFQIVLVICIYEIEKNDFIDKIFY